jgi:hypothetical protein
MDRKNKNDDHNIREKKASPKKKDNRSSRPVDDFNTGSHSPASLRNVGPGYDDTGLGNDLKKPGVDNKNSSARPKNK